MPDLQILVSYTGEESRKTLYSKSIRVSLDTFHFQKGKLQFLSLVGDGVERMKKFTGSHTQKWSREVGQGLGLKVEELGPLFPCP